MGTMTVRETVLHVLAENCDTAAADIKLSDSLDGLGIDSLSLLEVGMQLEEIFSDKAYMGSDDLGNIATVEDLINFLER
jgi:acyl carrier protein